MDPKLSLSLCLRVYVLFVMHSVLSFEVVTIVSIFKKQKTKTRHVTFVFCVGILGTVRGPFAGTKMKQENRTSTCGELFTVFLLVSCGYILLLVV
jgi:hypothetical protein